VFIKVGVPFLTVLDEYESYAQRDLHSFVGGDPARALEYATNVLAVVQTWARAAEDRGDWRSPNAAAYVELKDAMVSGRLRSKLDGLRSKLETMPLEEAGGLRQQLGSIEETLGLLELPPSQW